MLSSSLPVLTTVRRAVSADKVLDSLFPAQYARVCLPLACVINHFETPALEAYEPGPVAGIRP